MPDQEQKLENSFAGVIFSFLCRLSELTYMMGSLDYTSDMLWAMLAPYVEGNDRIKQDFIDFTRTDNDYQNSMGKVKTISLTLYHIGLLPKRAYGNRVYKYYTESGEESNKSEHVTDSLDLNALFARHAAFLSQATRKGADVRSMIDLLWNLLSPYITEEDMAQWQDINATFFNPKHYRYSPYYAMVEHLKICAGVMNRADFLLHAGIVDYGKSTKQETWRKTVIMKKEDISSKFK